MALEEYHVRCPICGAPAALRPVANTGYAHGTADCGAFLSMARDHGQFAFTGRPRILPTYTDVSGSTRVVFCPREPR